MSNYLTIFNFILKNINYFNLSIEILKATQCYFYTWLICHRTNDNCWCYKHLFHILYLWRLYWQFGMLSHILISQKQNIWRQVKHLWSLNLRIMGLICVWKNSCHNRDCLIRSNYKGKGNWYIFIFSNGTFS